MTSEVVHAGIVVRFEGREAEFGAGEITVGRDYSCTIRIDDPRLEATHLVVRPEGDVWVAEARGPTFSAGDAVERVEIRGPVWLALAERGRGVQLQLVPAGAEEPAQSATVAPVPRERTPTPGRLSSVLDLGGTPAAPVRLRPIRIGRGSTNEIVVRDLLVSRHHAELRPAEAGHFELVDLDSRNGTFVNGRRVSRAPLHELDVVMVGRHSFRLVGSRLEEYIDAGLVSFKASGLSVTAPNGRTLLDDVSFSLDERCLLGVVGPSGSGKSTLLGALTGFRPAQRGSVLYDGLDLYEDYDALRTRIGLVPQEDVVQGPLTVHQALSYAAQLRFPHDVAPDERNHRVLEVLDELGLEEAADTRLRDLSVGQRRRASVGIELITRPSLLLLDEPTSGLDPGYERSLMQLFRNLADDGRTVVVVTHSVQSLRLCDRVLFLAPGGQPAYFGPVQLATTYFGREDLQEVFQDLSASRQDWSKRFREHDYYRQYVASRMDDALPAPDRPRRAVLPSPGRWFAQASVLTRRYARVVASDRRNAALLLLQPVLLGLIMLAALPPHELDVPPEGAVRLASRAGLVLLVVILGATWLGASNAIREIVKEKPLFQRERNIGQHVSAYVASKAIVLGTVTLVQSAILVALATARQGGPEQGSVFGWPRAELMLGAGLAGLAAMSVGLFISSVSKTVDRAITVLPVVLIVEMLLAMGGVFPDVVEKPVLKQASKVASTQWGFAAVASTVELDRLQTVDRVAQDLSTVKPSDPLPLLRELSDQAQDEPRWSHDWQTWTWDALRLLLLTAAGLLGSVLALRRRRLTE